MIRSLECLAELSNHDIAAMDEILRSRPTERFSETMLKRSGAQKYRTAGVATTLVPLIEKEIGDGLSERSRITITGNTGYPDELGIWHTTLGEWLAKGCFIDYFLLNASALSIQALRRLKECFPSQLAVFSKTQSRPLTENERERFRQWETFHFAYVEEPDFLWIENHHAAGSLNADDCWHLTVKGKSVIFDEIRARWSLLKATGAAQAVVIP